MELHSYAKRRAASKKWTVEQKRKLVEGRIIHDGMFSKKPSNCVNTWKKIITLSKLDDFSVSFVRKQWSNMVAKYKQFKQTRLGNMTTTAIDDEAVRKITQDWEFFYPIHCFMSRKITKLHSYALTQGEGKQKASNNSNILMQQAKKEQNGNNSSVATSQLNTKTTSNAATMTLTQKHDNIITSPEIMSGQNAAIFNSDANDNYAAAETVSSIERNNDSQDIHATSSTLTTTCRSEAQTFSQILEDDMQSSSSAAAKIKIQNTDHDFYSKKSPKQRKLANCKEKLVHKPIETEIKTEISNDDNNTLTDREQNPNQINSTNMENEHGQEQESIATTLNNTELVQNTFNQNAKPTIMVMIPKEEPKDADAEQGEQKRTKRNERDKYYRHKRRFNRRLEHRFDALLNVFGQIVKAEYPSVDVSPLFGANVNTNGPQQTTTQQQSGFFGGATFSSDEFSEAEMSTSNDELMESQGETTMEEE